MNTNTVNPEAPTTEPTDQRREPADDRPGRPFGYDPEGPALRRPHSDRVLTGVAAGLARYFGVDVTVVRIAFVVLTIIGGAGIPLYLAGLLLIPEEGSDQSIAGAIIESVQNRSR